VHYFPQSVYGGTCWKDISSVGLYVALLVPCSKFVQSICANIYSSVLASFGAKSTPPTMFYVLCIGPRCLCWFVCLSHLLLLALRIGQVIHGQSDDSLACCLLWTLRLFMFTALMYYLLPNVQALMYTIVLWLGVHHVFPPHVWPIWCTTHVSWFILDQTFCPCGLFQSYQNVLMYVYISCFACLYAFNFNLFPHLYGIYWWLGVPDSDSATIGREINWVTQRHRRLRFKPKSTQAQRKHIVFRLKARHI
jgi:hypothetical protein